MKRLGEPASFGCCCYAVFVVPFHVAAGDESSTALRALCDQMLQPLLEHCVLSQPCYMQPPTWFSALKAC
jgi:hypothetical protein